MAGRGNKKLHTEVADHTQIPAPSTSPAKTVSKVPIGIVSFKPLSKNSTDEQILHSPLCTPLRKKQEVRHVIQREDGVIDPKVCIPYVTRKDQVPREVEVERKKRYYKSINLKKLMQERMKELRSLSIFQKVFNDRSGTALKVLHRLDLKWLDDDTFEIRSPLEWISLGTKSDKSVAIPARVQCSETDEADENWYDARVISYDSSSLLFKVQLLKDDGEVSLNLSRLHICFDAEDPHVFADRVITAHVNRLQAQDAIRKAFYIDCMPVEELHSVGNESLNRIVRLAISVFLAKNERAPDTTTLLHEAQIDFLRSSCEIIFRFYLARLHDETLESFFTPHELKNSCGILSKIDNARKRHDRASQDLYVDQFVKFSFQSLYNSPDALSALLKVNEECFRISNLELFSTKVSRVVKLEEFQQRQLVVERASIKVITEEWSIKVATIIRTLLMNVGKGWYNLEENRHDTYQFSKLRTLLRRVNFMMQDTQRYLIFTSLRAYRDVFQRGLAFSVRIVDPKTVHPIVFEEMEGKNGHENRKKVNISPSALFSVQMELSKDQVVINQDEMDVAAANIAKWNKQQAAINHEDKGDSRDAKSSKCPHTEVLPKLGRIFGYHSPLPTFRNAVLEIFNRCLGNLKNVKQIEQMVMTKLFWSEYPCITSVSIGEPWVIAIRDDIDQIMSNAINPLQDYLKEYKPYILLMNINEDDYIADFQQQKQPINLISLQEAIREHYNEADAAESRLPAQSIEIGMFSVDCSHVRNIIAEKHRRLAKRLLEWQLHNCLFLARSILEKFESISRQLQKSPSNIEELTEMNAYLENVSTLLAPLVNQIQLLTKYRLVLDQFQYSYDREDFMTIWRVRLCPLQTQEKIKRMEYLLGILKAQFAAEMKDQQAEYAEVLRVLHAEVDAIRQYTDLARLDQVIKVVMSIEQKLAKAEADAALFRTREGLFGYEQSDYIDIEKIRRDFEPYAILWKTSNSWIKEYKGWMDGPFLDLDGDDIGNFVDNHWSLIQKAAAHFEKSGIKGCMEIANTIRDEIAAFRPNVPLIISLRNPGMQERHWNMMNQEIKKSFRPDRGMKLGYVLELGLDQHLDAIMRICDMSGKEYMIEKSLNTMEENWNNVLLQVVPYRETETYILKGVDEIQTLLDEQITTIQTMQFSPFNKLSEDRINRWDRKLNTVSDVMEEWMRLQRSWLYLQPIFDSPDISKQLPMEGKRFATVDKNWRQTLANARQKPNVLAFCDNDKFLDRLHESNRFLDQVQKGLNDFLETKRSAFCRFYFLSNEELLSVLSESKDIRAVQPHFKKCFEGLVAVEFQADLSITAMISAEQERVMFSKAVNPVNKNIEHWMTEVEDMMRVSIKDTMCKSIQEYTRVPRGQWIQKWPGMCVINGSQFHWTREMEEMMREFGKRGVEMMMENQISQLADMVQLVRGPLSKLARISIGALTVTDVHARDVTRQLMQNQVESKDDFMWFSQLRYYWENDLVVEMVSAKRPYGYEYLGNSFRLVITPLTDKCYMTLLAALHMTLGGAPAGPAGTGKTETTKDLAKALAKQCVVFNCSDGLDYIAMGKFFKGLAACGAWACFDEFNRINIEVLSVIGQQITTIQLAIRAGVKQIYFEGSEIRVNAEFGVFITMNPGYAGRSELPDSLAALFRPVAMMVPDYAMIGEIMFFAYGYEKAKECGAKMVTTFKLCSEQLSSQSHYDYGMRAVKTVITAAGNYKRLDPDMDEELLLLRALQDVNLPKFLAHDIPLFDGIVADLFPKRRAKVESLGSFHTAVIASIEAQRLQPHPSFLLKVTQLYETLCVRHGLMIVGSTGSGKTSNHTVLAEALGRLKSSRETGPLYERVIRSQLNPKSITMGQLYGEFDDNTHEWQDGILSTLYRHAANDTSSDRKWIIFDGPVDAIWIENMNTVLDDNKKLCLASGEIIQMSNEMTMMFEVEDLSVASPATVSRTGMVYMETNSLGYDPLIRSWMDTFVSDIIKSLRGITLSFVSVYNSATMTQLSSAPSPFAWISNFVQKLERLFALCVPSALDFVTRSVNQWLPPITSNLVQSFLRLLECLLSPLRNQEQKKKDQKEEEGLLYTLHLQNLFIFALIWSLGAVATEADRLRFDVFLRHEIQFHGIECTIPVKNTVYDYSYDMQHNEWKAWLETIPPFAIDPTSTFSEIVVPTVDSVRSFFLMQLALCNRVHMLFVGPTGTGKTVNIDRFLGLMDADRFVGLKMSFSAQTTANQTQDFIDSKLEKRRKNTYGPSAGKTFIIYVDDLNMPKQEQYFAQPPIEMLRQWFDQGGWYDRKSLVFRSIIDIAFVCSMVPPGGGRNPITNRFIRHFNIIGTTEVDDASKQVIFETILGISFAKIASEEVKSANILSKLVRSSISIYNTVTKELLPTPAKPHYTFNLRDLAKVFQGFLMMDPRRISTSKQIVRLWVHENMRVYADRFTNGDDFSWFQNLLQTQVSTYFQREILQANLAHSSTPQEIWQLIHPEESLIYGDFMYPGADPKHYEEIADMGKLQQQVEDYLNEYNAESNAAMHLVMFMNAIEHVSRISRVLRQTRGNALLLGVGGSGRQSLTRLSAYMAEYSTVQIDISKTYGITEWRDDLRKVLMKAALEEKPLVFLFSDAQLVHDTMLEDLNNVLNSGDVPNLYGPEDLDQISTRCRPICVRKKILPTKINTFAQYLILVRQNLHLVLCMSPMGSVFRDRVRMFPSLVNCCTIDWFREWPTEALESVAASTLRSFFSENTSDVDAEDIANTSALIKIFPLVHQNVERASASYYELLRRYNYVTPASYLEQLNIFKTVWKLKREDVHSKQKRLQNGVDKIVATKEQVSGMQEQLIALKPQLEKTQIEVEALMQQITVDKRDADDSKSIVSKEEEIANRKAADTTEIANDAQRDLDEALPALDRATQCLNRLKKSDIDEVKALKNPPHGVRLTMEVACIIFGVKPTVKIDPDKPGQKIKDYWESAQKTILGNAKKLMEDMLKFDKDNISEKTIQQIHPYIEMEDFSPEAVRKASLACEAICMWVRAMHTYHNISKLVEPKKMALAAAQEELDITLSVLADAKARLQAIVNRLEELEDSYNAAVEKKDQLVQDVQLCEVRLDSALKLIGLLGGEESRWSATIAQLKKDDANLIGDVVISAATISYLGPFTAEFRDNCVQKWYFWLNSQHIAFTKGCGIISTLADPIKIRGWQIAGLPSDNLSIQNGIIMARARRWPLLIDPQGQANRFIKTLGRDIAENGFDVTDPSDKNFIKTLENGVRFGKWILVENVGESLDAALEPILMQNKFKQGAQTMLKIGDSNIPYHESFRFFMTTKLGNPHYTPESSVKVTLLNFTITPKGLEDQALEAVVQEEMPDLAEKKSTLVVSNARMKAELVEIENKILFILANSKGNILDDVELIDTLSSAKITSEGINEKMLEAEVTERTIDESREMYRIVAFRASLLFFCIADLAFVNPMYQYSLPWFLFLFVKSIRAATQSEQLSQRLEYLNDSATYSVYRNICRSLFEEHKLLFSFLLTIKLLQGENKVNALEWRFLISGTCPESPSAPENPDASWIEDRMWREICALSTLSTFHQLAASICSNPGLWRLIFDSADPHNEPLPVAWGKNLSTFQKLCILRCFRPDRMMTAVQDFVIECLGRRYIESPPFDIASTFEDTTIVTPIIFVLSTGSDPSKELNVFAESMKMSKKLNSISLGQGQGILATKMIAEAVVTGKWALLQNCHLAISWMPQLERICEEINPDTTHRDFRLWLTSRPCEAFPTLVLQNGVKISKEPPKGIRANLRDSYCRMTSEELQRTTKPKVYQKLLFALSFFHAVVIERKRFGPLGWNIPYAFNDTDYDISRSQLEMFLDLYDQIPYKVLCVMTSVVNYGGRVTDDKDMRTINVILENYFNPNLLEAGYKFSESGLYHVPEIKSGIDLTQAHLAYIDRLPLNSEPEEFGMHPNANISCAMAETFSMFDTISGLQPRVAPAEGQPSQENIIAQHASSIEKRLPPLFDLERIRARYPVMYEESMNTVLMQETLRYNALLQSIQLSLQNLQKALKGLIVMSSELESTASSIFNQKVPYQWEQKAYPSLKPLGSWFEDLLERIQFLSTWVAQGFPLCFWISGLFFPQGFLTGILQNHARQHTLAVDTLSFQFLMIDPGPQEIHHKADEGGCYIYGLFLEAARWDKEYQSLIDPAPKELYTKMPVIHLLPVQNRRPPQSGIYRCPVYKILTRTGTLSTTGHSANFVMWIEIPSARPTILRASLVSETSLQVQLADQDYWIKAGVACFLSLRYE